MLLLLLFISFIYLAESINLTLNSGHNWNKNAQLETIYNVVENLLNDLRNCPNDRLLELLDNNQPRNVNRNSQSRLIEAHPHRLTRNFSGYIALDIHLNHRCTGWRAIFSYDNNNNVIFYGIGKYVNENKYLKFQN